ncbi:MAG TPA: hypothetical protein VK457_21985 [Chloroflexota bacterium]|nr:hypothetical protein [Chloroflexota bacterium]
MTAIAAPAGTNGSRSTGLVDPPPPPALGMLGVELLVVPALPEDGLLAGAGEVVVVAGAVLVVVDGAVVVVDGAVVVVVPPLVPPGYACASAIGTATVAVSKLAPASAVADRFTRNMRVIVLLL